VPVIAAPLAGPFAPGVRLHIRRGLLGRVVVFDGPLALLRLGDRDVEIEVEVAVQRRRPGKFQPIRRLYACSFASGARDTAQSINVHGWPGATAGCPSCSAIADGFNGLLCTWPTMT